MIAFSPARRGRDGTFKDTYSNLLATRECTVQAVTHAMLHQINVASAEWPPDVDEFVKSGLTPIESQIVKPPRVKESPFQMECVLRQMIPFGDGKASGNLALCEVVMFHLEESLLDDHVINPARIDHVARNGGNWWTRVTSANTFKLAKPSDGELIGYDNLPRFVRESQILSANNLGQLANYPQIPSAAEAQAAAPPTVDEYNVDRFQDAQARGDFRLMFELAQAATARGHRDPTLFVRAAKIALDTADDRAAAWSILILGHSLTE